MSSICQIPPDPETPRPLVSSQPPHRGGALRPDRAVSGPVAVGLHRDARGHRSLPGPLARRRTWRKERFHPPEQGADRLHLAPSGSWPWRTSSSPAWTCAGSSARCRMACGSWDSPAWRSRSALFFRAMMANRFFSAVIRIQKDRGHHVIDQGPTPSSGTPDTPEWFRPWRSAAWRSDRGLDLRSASAVRC